MNSLLQQLYLVPNFRRGILAAEDKSKTKEDSVLYQTQLLFANLQETAKKFFDTRCSQLSLYVKQL